LVALSEVASAELAKGPPWKKEKRKKIKILSPPHLSLIGKKKKK
jgi:hypothetical protein